ncbi:hypothetical protein ACIPX0_38290 [Streptomyces sp. NPDC090075]|uniref:hypothetical protein n=1 Tax=Streptomyces sp. NPDC090075 TaxID=3365937 RepID=UPI0037F12702
MAKNFRKDLQESRNEAAQAPTIRVGIPQIDPGEQKAVIPEEPAVIAEPQSTSKPEPKTPVKTGLAMPPSRQQEVRAQFNTKLPPELIDRIKTFTTTHRADIQDVSELALDEFLKARGF